MTQGRRGQPNEARVTSKGGINDNNDQNGNQRNGEAGAKSQETVDRQNNEDELMREDFQEVNQIHKESIKDEYLNGKEVMGKEVNSAKEINPMIVVENLVNVHVEYVGETQPACNNVPQDQKKIAREEAREITKTQTRDHTENMPKWKRLVRQTDSPMRVTNTSPNKSGSKRGQPERDRDDEEEERKKKEERRGRP